MRLNCHYYHGCRLPTSKCNSQCKEFKKANWEGIKPKKEIMKEGRARKRAAGLVPFSCWCTPEAKKELQELATKLERDR